MQLADDFDEHICRELGQLASDPGRTLQETEHRRCLSLQN